MNSPKPKDGNEKKSASFISLQVLGSGSRGTPASLYVFTDQSRYLFNCGEGTQRLANEHKFKLAKLEHVFITDKRWQVIGGLPGLGLNIQDTGARRIDLHGPPSLEGIFTSTRNFVILESLHVHVHSYLSKPFFEDHILRVDYVPLYADDASSSNCELSNNRNDDDEWDDLNDDTNGVEALIDYHPVLDGSAKELSVTVEAADENYSNKLNLNGEENKNMLNTNMSLCYICTPKRKEATLLMDRCKQLGVPQGPFLKQLKSGQNVTLPNGKVVLASDVTSQDSSDPIFIVIDCPQVDFLTSLVTNPIWTEIQTSKGDVKIAAVVHFTPAHILQSPDYMKWMETFGKNTQHLLLNDCGRNSGNDAAHRLQETLHVLDEDIFPLLFEGEERVKASQMVLPNENDSIQIQPPLFSNLQVPVVLGTPLLNCSIRPSKGINSYFASLASKNHKFEIGDTTAEEINKLKMKNEKLHSKVCQQEFPKVLFLGTGSCIPNKSRNVSSILLEISSESKMILDCGEGTFGQMLRFYGSLKIDRVLTQLKAIYVSHLHADHHLGLISLLQERRQAFDKLKLTFIPVVLLAPQQILFWLRFYHRSFEKIKHTFVLVPNSDLSISKDKSSCQKSEMVAFKELLCDTELDAIETVLVDHCPDAFGVSLRHRLGWKIVYSGDTRPCDNLVSLGMDCTLCIHEATMEDELIEEAKYKMHCTMSEAIDMGKRMKAKFVMLTHFSQRYAKLPKIGIELDSNVGIAYDNMLIGLNDLPKIPGMYPVLKLLFAHEYEAMESKTLKKIQCQK